VRSCRQSRGYCALPAGDGIDKLPETLVKQTFQRILDFNGCEPLSVTNFYITVADLFAACPAGEPEGTAPPLQPQPTMTPPAPAPQPSSSATPQQPTPQPSAHPFWTYRVYGTCADGKCGLNLRSGPGYSHYAVVGVRLDADPVNIACQTRGERVSNGRSSSSVWNRLENGAWASDFYINTPNVDAFTPPIPQC